MRPPGSRAWKASSGRSATARTWASELRSWLKFKIVNELDAVICGWTAPRRSREFFGALVLGIYNGGKLEFIGSVGTGFDHAAQKKIYEQLKKCGSQTACSSEAPN